MNVDINHETNNNNEVSQILVALLNKSFLAPYLKLDITDISFNGTDLYICDNVNGRVKVDNIEIKPIKVLELTRQIANLMGKNFNYTHPILEVSFDKYRLSAVYSSAYSKLELSH